MIFKDKCQKEKPETNTGQTSLKFIVCKKCAKLNDFSEERNTNIEFSVNFYSVSACRNERTVLYISRMTQEKGLSALFIICS